MMKETFVRLGDIPKAVLPTMASTERATIYYGRYEVKEIFEFKGKIRLNTDGGQYRVSEDKEIQIWFG